MERGFFVIGFFMIVVGIPILAVFGMAAYSRWLQHRQLQLILEERKLLIEKGVTDLPPLGLPKLPRRTDRLRNLKAGIILLFIAGAFAIGGTFAGAPFWGGSPPENIGLVLILAALGLALLVIHAISSHYERREAQEQGPSGEENASVIEVDIEE
ncbi:MAG: hypothetical protein IBV52_03580 [Candidatus Bathyarchaeota archaeon]